MVASLARPGGNLTGISVLYSEMLPKRFELLAELVPQARVIGLLVNPRNPNVDSVIADAQNVARTKRVPLTILKAGTESEVAAVFSSLGQSQVGAVIVGTDAFFNSHREQLGEMALRHAVPAIYKLREFAASGGLASYAPDTSALRREFGIYAWRQTSRSASPAADQVRAHHQHENSEALGLTVPQSLLARADEVIE